MSAELVRVRGDLQVERWRRGRQRPQGEHGDVVVRRVDREHRRPRGGRTARPGGRCPGTRPGEAPPVPGRSTRRAPPRGRPCRARSSTRARAPRRLGVARAVEDAERRVGRALEIVGVAVRADHERRHVAGVREAHGAVVGLEHEVEQRGHLAAVEAAHERGRAGRARRRANGRRARRRASHGAAGPSAPRPRCRGRPRRPSPRPRGRPRAGSRRTSRRPRRRHRACSGRRSGCPRARAAGRAAGCAGASRRSTSSRSYARACSMASPARSAISISRLSSSSVNRRAPREPTSTTPATSPFTTSGDAISDVTPAASIARVEPRAGRQLRSVTGRRPLDHLLERAADLHGASRARPRAPPPRLP